MREWQQNLIGAIVVAVIGTVMILWATKIDVPQSHKTFLGIPYAVDPEFIFAFQQMMLLLLFGFLFLGLGLGILVNTNSIRKLEKKLEKRTSSVQNT